MTLRRKSLFIIVLALVSLVTALSGIYHAILSQVIAAVENESAQREAQQARAVLDDQLATLQAIAADWAEWDDTYAFIEVRDPAYVESNLVDSTFQELGLNLMVYLDRDGQKVYEQAYDLRRKEPTALPLGLQEHLAPGQPLADPQASQSGLLLLPHRVLLASAAPILTSAGQGPSRGKLVIARELDAAQIQRLGGLVNSPLRLLRLDDPALPQGLGQDPAAQAAATPVTTHRLDGQTIAGYSLLQDIYGQPALLMEVQVRRDASYLGLIASNLYNVSMGVVVLVFCLLTMILLDKLIVGRVLRLIDETAAIGRRRDLEARVSVSGGDELTRLSQAVNGMLDGLQASEGNYRRLLEQASDGILVADPDWSLLEVNSKACQMFGQSQEQLQHCKLSDLIPVDGHSTDPERYARPAGEAAALHEHCLKRPDGGSLPVEISAGRLDDGRYQAILRDIRERKQAEAEKNELLVDLQCANQALIRAYDDTILGWSRALELRDGDTEGHTQRVADLATELGRALGMPQANLVHLRRGALLHDIGKLAIPDCILSKPGPLNETEWEVMRQHPQLAGELLDSIEFLKPCIDVPLYHHERWDGRGYPFGLQGEAIPLAARIFAVVDVWDALTSDRPYRPAWEESAALEYIREQTGAHFDPAVVEIFFAKIGSREEGAGSGEQGIKDQGVGDRENGERRVESRVKVSGNQGQGRRAVGDHRTN